MLRNVRVSATRVACCALLSCGALAAYSASAQLTHAANVAPNAGQAPFGERARWIAGRLIAPCCWTQTLDIHDSELSTELRLEIAQRVANGEGDVAIEDDLARRYGSRIRAVPTNEDPRMYIVVGVGLAMLLTAYGIVRVARRLVARGGVSGQSDPNRVGGLPSDSYDAALEAELSRLRSHAAEQEDRQRTQGRGGMGTK